jgi:hypothetical protein
MAFWSSGKTEPKRNYRFKVSISGFNANNVVWWAKSVTVPSYDVSEVEHNFFDNKYYYPGRASWSEVSLTMVDPISPDAVQLTNQLLIDSGYFVPSTVAGVANKRTISKRRAIGRAFLAFTIDIVDSEGKTIEKWKLNNVFIKSAKYGDLAYDSDDLRTVEMSLRYDWAECEILKGHPDSPSADANRKLGKQFEKTDSPA